MKTVNVFDNIGPTRHFEERARERGLSREVVDFIVTWGTAIETRDNAYYFTVVHRDLPDGMHWSRLARRAEGWVLVISERGTLITCFRQHNAWRYLRRGKDHRRRAA